MRYRDENYVDGGEQCEHLTRFARCKYKARQRITILVSGGTETLAVCFLHSKVYREAFSSRLVETIG